MSFKLGHLQRRILHYLALNPNQNMQVIQRSLGIEDKNYPSVRAACKGLTSKDLIQSKEGKSEKQRDIKFWSLTQTGENYLFTNDSFTAQELDIVLDSRAKPEEREELKAIHVELGTELMLKTLKMSAVINALRKGKAPSIDFSRMIVYQGIGADVLTDEERSKVERVFRERVRRIVKSDPILRKRLSNGFRRLANFQREMEKALELE